jgi:hypothetical protein
MSFAHQSGAGGVTVHGLLTGLGADDHLQYALADKSRPSPWVDAADLAGRSLADLGTKHHHLLAGLADDDHSQYAFLAGRSGGQTLIGDTASGGLLNLQSTAHATKGYVNIAERLTVGPNASPPDAGDVLYVKDEAGHSGKVAIAAIVGPYTFAAGGRSVGLGGYAQLTDGGTGMEVYGLLFNTIAAKKAAMTRNVGVSIYTNQINAATANQYQLGLWVRQPVLQQGTLTIEAIGLAIDDITPAATPPLAIGIRVREPSLGTARHLAWLGGTTPLLRLDCGTPAANCTQLWLAEGVTPTLRNVQWKLFSTLVAGDRVAVLV